MTFSYCWPSVGHYGHSEAMEGFEVYEMFRSLYFMHQIYVLDRQRLLSTQ